MTIFGYDGNNLGGGGYGGDGQMTQKEYLNICHDLVNGDDNKKKKSFDDLIDILKERVNQDFNELKNEKTELERLKKEYPTEDSRDFNSMLLTENKKIKMNQLFDALWTDLDADVENKNYLLKFSVTCLVVQGIFTENATNKDVPKVIQQHKRYRRFNPNPNPDVDSQYKFSSYSYSVGKEEIQTRYEQIFTNPAVPSHDYGKSTYFIFFVLPYLGITCMLDAWIEHDIWFLGFSTRYGSYDGGYRWVSPHIFTAHDFAHYSASEYSNNVPQKLKDFYIYIKKNYKGVQLYQIIILLFWFSHEVYYFGFFQDDDAKINKEFEWDYAEPRFTDEEDMLMSLPPRIRDDYNKSKNFGIIKEYFEEGLKVFCGALGKFNKAGGALRRKRKTKKSSKSKKRSSLKSFIRKGIR